jgi:hypothetical protein
MDEFLHQPGFLGTNANWAADMTLVINAFFGDGTAHVFQSSGRGLQPMQTGRIQQYILASILIMIVLAGLAFFLLMRG